MKINRDKVPGFIVILYEIIMMFINLLIFIFPLICIIIYPLFGNKIANNAEHYFKRKGMWIHVR